MDDDIAALAMQGLSAAEIGDRIGISARAVQKRIAKLMAVGLLPRARERRGKLDAEKHGGIMAMQRSGKPWGSMRALAKDMPPSVVAWLADQVPEGGTVSDVLYALVVDAYFEDRGDE